MEKEKLTKSQKETLSNLAIYIPLLDEKKQQTLLEATRGLVLIASIKNKMA